jgi:hypothetical protein
MTLSIITQHNDTWHNDTWHNDTWHNDTWHNDTQYNDTWHNDNKHNGTALICRMSFMLSATFKPFMPSVAIPNVIMLNAAKLNVMVSHSLQ